MSSQTPSRPLPFEGSEPTTIEARADEQPSVTRADRSPEAISEAGEAAPWVLTGPSSVRAVRRGVLQDDRSSEQAASAPQPGWMVASSPRGKLGEGRGGEASKTKTAGSGANEGAGSKAQALGARPGRGGWSTTDVARRSYLRNVQNRIHNSWSVRSFPMAAAIKGKQGYTIVGFSIGPSGGVRAIRTLRGSGFPSFDAAMRAAVARAGPFGPLPAEFGGPLRHSHEFVASNPAVR